MYSRVCQIAGSLVFLLMSAVVLVPISNAAEATPTSVMKHDNFEYLMFSLSLQPECPASRDEVNQIFKGELLRARLKNFNKALMEGDSPEGYFPSGYMALTASCLKRNDMESLVFSITANWHVDMNLAGEQLLVKLVGYIGYGPKDAFKEGVEDVVEEAITKYLEANLD